MQKREDVLEGLEGRERELKLLDHKRNDRVVAKRKAQKDPEKSALWAEEYSPEAVNKRRRIKNLNERCETMRSMSTIDGCDFIRQRTERAVKAARCTASKTSPDELQKWYPNVLTAAEVEAVRANGGAWPGCDVP